MCQPTTAKSQQKNKYCNTTCSRTLQLLRIVPDRKLVQDLLTRQHNHGKRCCALCGFTLLISSPPSTCASFHIWLTGERHVTLFSHISRSIFRPDSTPAASAALPGLRPAFFCLFQLMETPSSWDTLGIVLDGHSGTECGKCTTVEMPGGNISGWISCACAVSSPN